MTRHAGHNTHNPEQYAPHVFNYNFEIDSILKEIAMGSSARSNVDLEPAKMLLARDPEKKYISFLNAYVETGFNITEVSKKLCYHRNTVKYHFQKIYDLCGVEVLENSQGCNALRLYLTLKLMEIRNQRPPVADIPQEGEIRIGGTIFSIKVVKEEENRVESEPQPEAGAEICATVS